MLNRKLVPGIYRHFKGQHYRVYDIASHSETEEAVVVYRCLYGERGLWVRPVSMFFDHVNYEGEQVPRFELIEACGGDALEQY